MPVERNLKLIGYFAFFTNALFVVPILLPFYKDHIGLGYQGLLLGEAAFAASCILFDVPTSWISDVWRRKYSLWPFVVCQQHLARHFCTSRFWCRV